MLISRLSWGLLLSALLVTSACADQTSKLETPENSVSPSTIFNSLLGKTTITNADGSIYIGQMKDGKFEGEGTLTWPDKRRYEGSFVQGMMHGEGKFTDANGNRHEGMYARGIANGKGKSVRMDGVEYTGGFVDGQFAGEGVLTINKNSRYEGVFSAGKLEGVGLYVGAKGDSYEGEFKASSFHGKGRLETETGDVYTGNFKANSLEGEGQMTQLDGTRYVGEMQYQYPHGKGTFTYANGDVYIGNFRRGKFDGEGVLTLKEPREDGTKEQKGIWLNGQFSDPNIKEEKLTNEKLLYNQTALLQAQFDALKPRSPNQANMYFLGIAGDGGMEVFRREVQTVAKQFEQNFATTGHTVILVNSAESTATLPIANKISMQRALDAIAKKMDKQNDILFLFMTSHGSRDHEFSLRHPSIEISDLPAKTLASMLESTGIRHKVIVISACYSGGFIDSLENENHLILTAARRDRNSFGCATENNFTYFGRAFFKEALPKSTSFEDAFARAKIIISEWEGRDFVLAKKNSDYLEARRKRLKIAPPVTNPILVVTKAASQIANAVRNFRSDKTDNSEDEGQPSLPQIYAGKKITPVLESWWKARNAVK